MRSTKTAVADDNGTVAGEKPKSGRCGFCQGRWRSMGLGKNDGLGR